MQVIKLETYAIKYMYYKAAELIEDILLLYVSTKKTALLRASYNIFDKLYKASHLNL